MAYLPTEPLTKVTLNLYTKDVAYMQRTLGTGWSTWIRALVSDRIKQMQEDPDAKRD